MKGFIAAGLVFLGLTTFAQDTIPLIDTSYNAPYVAIPYAYHQDDSFIGYSSEDLSELDNYELLAGINIRTGERIPTTMIPGNLNFKTDDSTFFKIAFGGGDQTYIHEYEFISPWQLNFKRTEIHDLHVFRYHRIGTNLFRPIQHDDNEQCLISLMAQNLSDSLSFIIDSNPTGLNRLFYRSSFNYGPTKAGFSFQHFIGSKDLIHATIDASHNFTVDTVASLDFKPAIATGEGYMDLLWKPPYFYLTANHPGPNQSIIFSVYQLDSNLQKTGQEFIINGDSLKLCCGHYRDPYALYKITNDHHVLMMVSSTSLGLTHLDTVRSMIRKYKPDGSLVWERCFNPRGVYTGNSLNSIHLLGDTAYAVLGSFSFGSEHDGRNTWYFVLDTSGTNYQLKPGIGIEENIQGFDLYPIPSSNFLHVNGSFLNYSIYTVQGVLVLKGRFEQSIDISGLKPGPYFLVNEKGFARKFIVSPN